MRQVSWFNTAINLLHQYDGSVPLTYFLKQHFSQHKKHGSNDRKFIAHLCYCYYRLGHALKNIPVEERLKAAIFLCNDQAGEWAILFDENWLHQWSKLLEERIGFVQTIYAGFNIEQIFPWQAELSETIDYTAFPRSHLVQPDLFLRIRAGNKEIVLRKLRENKIRFSVVGENCLSLLATTKIDAVLQLNNKIVVQDHSSQRISEFLQIIKSNTGHQLSVWDCCAASGGKSILAYDLFENIELTVSDIRKNILQNLSKRFKEAGIKKYKSFELDLAREDKTTLPLGSGEGFDLIICDAPCTGSGTWGRTPEQLYFFSKEKIEYYASLQKKIISNTIPHLKKGGYFLYITCSVFKMENEQVAEFIGEQFNLQLVKMELLKGYTVKADTMFAALFYSPL